MKSIRKIIKWLVVVIVVVVAADAVIVFSFANTSSNIKKADAIIVMGAAINSPAIYNRTLKALELYKQGRAPVLVLSGGRISDKDISEAEYMKKVIVSNLKPSTSLGSKIIEAIILEKESNSTYENIKNSKAKLPKIESIIIVTDKYHIARSVLVAKRAGFAEVMWSAPDTEFPANALRYHYLREMAAMIDYLPKFIFN